MVMVMLMMMMMPVSVDDDAAADDDAGCRRFQMIGGWPLIAYKYFFDSLKVGEIIQ